MKLFINDIVTFKSKFVLWTKQASFFDVKLDGFIEHDDPLREILANDIMPLVENIEPSDEIVVDVSHLTDLKFQMLKSISRGCREQIGVFFVK